MTNSDVRVRAIRGDELDAFAASDDPRQAAWLRSYLAERVPVGRGRPEWCFVAEEGGRVAGRLAYWSPRPDGPLRSVDILDLPWDGDWPGIGEPLLRRSLSALQREGATGVDCSVDTPSGWDPFREQILELLARCGFTLRRETLRFEWAPAAGAPSREQVAAPPEKPVYRPLEPVAAPPERLVYRPLEEAGEDAFVEAIRTVMEGTLDRGHQQDLQRQGPERKAREYLDAARRMVDGGGWRTGPGWWQLAATPAGEFVGLLMPAINAAGTGIVWYVGVAPGQRGRRYIDDLLARLTSVLAAAGVTRIVADTDTRNLPMAGAFRRAGWTHFATSAAYVLDLTAPAGRLRRPARGAGEARSLGARSPRAPRAGNRAAPPGEPVSRRAVGAVVLQGDECLLVHKVKVMSRPGGPRPTAGVWDFPKVGVVGAETPAEAALRELREETGSNRYRVARVFAAPLRFEFGAATRAATGFARQETTMLLLEYLGDQSDLAPQDEEIDAVRFFPIERVESTLAHQESREFFERHVLERLVPAPGADRPDLPAIVRLGYAPREWLDPRVETRPSAIAGRGLFARSSLRAGEPVVVWGGMLVTRAEVAAGVADPDSTVPVAEGLYLAAAAGTYDREADDVGDLMNHSCDPTCWMRDEVTTATRRDLRAGEELTVDYALFKDDEASVSAWTCRCGTPLCRGRVTGRDWRRPDIQERYAGHFSPFLTERIRRLRSGAEPGQ